jgi:hypothetical protein
MNNNSSPLSGLKASNPAAWACLILMILLIMFYIHQIITVFNEVSPPEKFSSKSISDFISQYQSAAQSHVTDTSKPGADSLGAIAKTTGAVTYTIPNDSLDTFLKQGYTGAKGERNKQLALLWLVACCGGLGSMIYILSSFTSFWGNHKLQKIWFPWYVAKPVTGMGLALVGFLVLRAGFLSASTTTADINIYGLLAFSCFMGLFSDDATLKLKEVFDALFSPKDTRSGALNNAQSNTSGTTVSSITPATTKVGDATTFTITGAGFTSGLLVKCNNNPVTSQSLSSDSNSITFVYQAVAADGPTMAVVITDPSGAINDISVGSVTVTT